MTIAQHMTPESDLKLPSREVVLGANPNRYDSVRSLSRLTPDQRKAWVAAYGPKNERFYRDEPQGKERTRWSYQRYMKDYLRCVRAVDDSVGQLRKTLKQLGLADNTIVIYSSDQGFFLGDHGWYDKRWMYEESLRMPLIVHWPGVTTPGARVEALTQNLDFAETFLTIAGVTPPADMQGASLEPLLRGEEVKTWRDAIYYHYFEFPGAHSVARHYGVRTDRHKLMHFYEFDEWEFYDLGEDPDEATNAYDDPRHSDTIGAMKMKLEELRKKYADDTDFSSRPAEWRAKHRQAG